jgi:hypothetical protein
MKLNKKYKVPFNHIDSYSDTKNSIKYKPDSTISFIPDLRLPENRLEEYCQSIIASTRKLKK